MKKIIFITALLGMLIPAVAFAELRYDAVSIGYAKTSESGSADLNELDFGITKGITNNVYIGGSYATGSQASGTAFGDITVHGYEIDLGFHTPIKENIDFILLGGFLSDTASLGGVSVSGNGYGLGVGLRAELSPQIEGTISGTHTSVSANSSTTTGNGVQVELGFNITHELQLFGGIGSTSFSPDIGASYTDNTVAIGLHYFY